MPLSLDDSSPARCIESFKEQGQLKSALRGTFGSGYHIDISNQKSNHYGRITYGLLRCYTKHGFPLIWKQVVWERVVTDILLLRAATGESVVSEVRFHEEKNYGECRLGRAEVRAVGESGAGSCCSMVVVCKLSLGASGSLQGPDLIHCSLPTPFAARLSFGQHLYNTLLDTTHADDELSLDPATPTDPGAGHSP
jgi:hypothetical protein